MAILLSINVLCAALFEDERLSGKRLRGYVLTGLLLFVKTILKCLDCGQRKSSAIRPAFSLPTYLEGDFCMLRPGSR